MSFLQDLKASFAPKQETQKPVKPFNINMKAADAVLRRGVSGVSLRGEAVRGKWSDFKSLDLYGAVYLHAALDIELNPEKHSAARPIKPLIEECFANGTSSRDITKGCFSGIYYEVSFKEKSPSEICPMSIELARYVVCASNDDLLDVEKRVREMRRIAFNTFYKAYDENKGDLCQEHPLNRIRIEHIENLREAPLPSDFPEIKEEWSIINGANYLAFSDDQARDDFYASTRIIKYAHALVRAAIAYQDNRERILEAYHAECRRHEKEASIVSELKDIGDML